MLSCQGARGGACQAREHGAMAGGATAAHTRETPGWLCALVDLSSPAVSPACAADTRRRATSLPVALNRQTSNEAETGRSQAAATAVNSSSAIETPEEWCFTTIWVPMYREKTAAEREEAAQRTQELWRNAYFEAPSPEWATGRAA
jgi:hypothetical protein